MESALSHVHWIGGSPCSGKTTVADALAAACGLTVYRCDDAYFRRRELVTAELHPVFHRLGRLSGDDLWMRPVAQQIAEELALHREEFPLILADLARLPAGRPVIAEGAALLPELLGRIGVADRRCVWIVPTAAFQRTHYARRAWRHDELKDCADTNLAWRNWMARDVGFAQAVAAEARRRQRRLLVTDGSESIDATVQSVAAWLQLR